MMTRTGPYKLTPDAISHDTIECLEQLLSQAKSGHLLGVAFVAMYKRRLYIADAAGEAYRNPTFARGMVRALDDELSRLVHNP